MYLNKSLLAEELGKLMPVKEFGPSRIDGNLPPPLFYLPGDEMQPDHLYIAQGSELPDAVPPDGCCIVSIGEPPAVMRSGLVSCIVLQPDLNVGKLMNDIQSIFETLQRWESRLEVMADHNCSIRDFFLFCQPMFPGQFLLAVDSSRRVLETTSELDYVMDQTGHTPVNIVNIFKSNPDYVEMQQYKGSFFFHDPSLDHDILVYNVFVNDEYLGAFSLTGVNAPISLGRRLLFNRICEPYTRIFRQQFFRAGAAKENPISYFERMLLGEWVPPTALADCLSGIGWRIDNEYAVGVITLQEADRAVRAAAYLCQRLEVLLSYALPMEHGGDIVIIMNLSKDRQKSEHSLNTFRQFLDHTELSVGVSKAFRNLSELKNYYIQAREALRMGTLYAHGVRCHFFSDYVLRYMVDAVSAEISPESLCPSGLLELRALDHSRGSSYISTLETYFKTGCNATRTAKEMYINRSTFLARMSKITGILSLDLEDFNDRLYLMLCLKMLSNQGSI